MSDATATPLSTYRSTLDRDDPVPSTPFCDALSLLLDALSGGAPTRDIALLVARAKALAVGSGVLVLSEDDESTLSRMMSQHHVRSMNFSGQVGERDILQLAALLHGPVRQEGPSFAELWTRLGVWRITVQFAVPEEASDAASNVATGSIHGDASVRLAEAVNAADPRGAFAALKSVFDDERNASGDAKLAHTTRFDALATADALRVIVRLVAMGEPASHAGDPLRDLLSRAADAAADALFAQLSAAPSAGERRAYFDAIVAAGVQSRRFVSNLRHPQWYVVRNAAALLGALRVTDATESLVQTLTHADARVRIAIVDALSMLDTTLSRQALLLALSDSTSEVRHSALQGLQRLAVNVPSAVLVAALDREDRPEVQLELVCALHECTEKDTHQALVRFCARSLARGGSIAASLAALEVLARHRPTALATFLKHLEDHDDARVRAEVERLRDLAHQSQQLVQMG